MGNVLTDFDVERISKLSADDGGSSTSMMTRRKPSSLLADIRFQTAPLVAFCQWALEIKPSLSTLQEAAKACRTYPRTSLSSSTTGLSLVLYSQKTTADPDESGLQVVLVQWVIGGKTGRIADLDSEGRVKTIVPMGSKRIPIEFGDCEIIHPNTGIIMERVRKAERPKLPDSIQRLMNMWGIALQAHCLPEHKALRFLQQDEQSGGNVTISDSIVDANGASQALSTCLSSRSLCGSNTQTSTYVTVASDKGTYSNDNVDHDHPGDDAYGDTSLPTTTICMSDKPDEPTATTSTGGAAAASSSEHLTESDFIQKCCLCRLYWHKSCCMKLLKMINITSSGLGTNGNDNSIVYSIHGWDSTKVIDFTYEFTSPRSLQAPDCLPRYFQPSGAADDARQICFPGLCGQWTCNSDL